MTGVQALVRLVLDQRRARRARAGSTPGSSSPATRARRWAALDGEMARARRHLDPAGVVFQAGVNEELAATAVAGTQMLDAVPGRRHDGVVGFWYGKNPGLDRAADAIRHGNLAGTTHLGGAVAIIGDDPSSKSSTVPSSCEPMAESLVMPLLAPGSVAEVIELGLHAVALSRATGLWTGLKIIADVADASATVDLGELAHDVVARPGPAHPGAHHPRRAGRPGRAGRRARHAHPAPRPGPPVRPRDRAQPRHLRLAQRPARHRSPPAPATPPCCGRWTTSASARPSWRRSAIRLIRLAMPYPIDDAALAAMTAASTRCSSSRTRSPFLEGHLKQALYRHADAPGRRRPPRRRGPPAADRPRPARRRGRRPRARRAHRRRDRSAAGCPSAPAAHLAAIAPRAPVADRAGREQGRRPRRPRPVLLLGLPAQHLDPHRRRHPRRRRDRLPRDGRAGRRSTAAARSG